MILTDEFSRQAVMETDLGIPSALFAPPVREIIELGQSQLGFMNMFAIPLFQGVTDIMPSMQFCVDELNINKDSWKARIKEEQAKQKRDGNESMKDGMRSPRAMSLAVPHDGANHQVLNHSGALPSRVYNVQNTDLKGENQKTAPRYLDGIQANDSQDAKFISPKESDGVELNDTSSGNAITPGANSTARYSSKPTPNQLQLSYATASPPGYINHPTKSHEALGVNHHNLSNGIHIGNPLVTDATFNDAPTPRPTSRTHGLLRTSDTTDGSVSAPSSSDWASQATSATTSKLPLSPSTQGTSIMSTDSSAERTTPLPSHFSRPVTSPSTTTPSTATSQSCPAPPRPLSSSDPDYSNATPPPNVNSDQFTDQKNGSTTIIETMRSLAKKPSRSRFRMNFWKRKTTPPIPIPVSGAGQDPIPLGNGRHVNGS
jgi:3',5'-cyclic-nucleotide phosphodiesterase